MRGTRVKDPRVELRQVIARTRRRWRTRHLVRGLAVVFGAAFVVFLASTFAIDRAHFEPGVVLAFRVVMWTAVALLAAYFLVRPMLRRVTDEQVALYLEEHEPTLQSALLGALDEVDPSDRVNGSERLREQVVRTAVDRCRRVDGGRRVEEHGLRTATAWLAGVATAIALIFAFGPAFQGTAGSLLLSPFRSADAASPYSISVEPGDVLLSRGSDQRIVARPAGFEADEVVLAVRRGASETWERLTMVPGEEAGAYEVLLFDLDEPTEYLVEAEGVRTETFRIDVADLPYADRIDAELRFPAYTGLSPRVQEDAGDIAALTGTEVGLEITSTIPTPGARLVFLDREDAPVPLSLEGETFTGSFPVDREVFYRIEFEGPRGQWVVGSPDYLVEPLEDQPPFVTISDPGRDTQATSIEEVYIEVEAEDDFGIGTVELIYSVNGGEENTVTLHGTRRGGSREVSGGHTLFLEEIPLEPGDLISYYARARDLRSIGRQSAESDIYFVEIRPFDRSFRQADQAGQQGGGQGGGMNMEFSNRQRQIVAATFRLVRDEEDFDAAEMAENLTTLTLLQGRLREEVQSLVAEIGQRGVGGSEEMRVVAEELPRAAAAMAEAEAQLGERQPDDALPPEQRALQHLQRAEAAFREVQVQQGGGQGGGGGSSAAQTAEDLADLFELDLDRNRNQYETVQRGERQQQDQDVDEALQKLEELARRQQQLNERARAQAGQQGGSGGSGQQAMIEETERLARELERLSREDRQPELAESARRLQEAANAMRQAAAERRGGGAEGAEALERLNRARRLLQDRQAGALERDVADAVERARDIESRQSQLEQDVRGLGESPDRDRLQRVADRKRALAEDVDELEQDLDRMARESRGEQRDASDALREAANGIREQRIRDKLLYSQQLPGRQTPEVVRNFEEQISNDTRDLREAVEAAEDALQESDPRRLNRQLDEARDLVRGLESLQERVGQRLNREDDQEQQGQRGQQGQQGQGQQGGEQGQQGQDGQGDRQGQGEQGQGQPGQGQQGQQTGQGEGRGDGQPPSPSGTPSGAPGGGGRPQAGGLTPQDVRQFRSEFRERRSDAEALRDELRQSGVDVGELEGVIDELRRLEGSRAYDDEQALQRLQDAVLRGLRDFEFGLRRELGQEVQRLFLSGSDEVPPEYRELVEAYYRSLSEDGGR